MTSKDRLYRTLNFKPVDRVPRDLWVLPGVQMHRAQELAEVRAKYPSDITGPPVRYGPSLLRKGVVGEVGWYTDAWGCVFTVVEPGVIGEVKEPILRSLDDDFHIPWEILENADLSRVDTFCETSPKFVLAGTTVRPFERLQFLRGSENLFLDLAYNSLEFHRLKEKIHRFFVAEMEMWAATKVDGVSFMDDWGAQTSLLISPDMWREVFKPLYAEYCLILKGAGKYVFFHSDGYIEPIIPDLIEIGVDALNCQLFCMNIEELGEKYRGKITFWGEIDRQNILPFKGPKEVKEAVARVRRALDRGQGGVIAQCEWGNDVPKENIEAVFEAWLE
jgi:uroporphyrinogen decarboxylase